MSGTVVNVEGPYFEELSIGQVFAGAPALTLTDGLASAHQAIVGDRLRLPLDHELSRAVTGSVLAHPGLVCDVAIGQSTVVTQNVKANLFYRRLTLLHMPAIGDTLSTVTEVVGLRQNSPQPGRASTGLAALHMTTTDQRGRTVLDFFRCAMLPLRDQELETGFADDLSLIGSDLPQPDPAAAISAWNLDALLTPLGSAGRTPEPGTTFQILGGDVVSSAPELARLTLNIAAAHHDDTVGGRRLVYGGHTIGLALAQAARALPQLVTVLSWQSCDHTGPVHEGDTLRSTLTVRALTPRPEGGSIAELSSLVSADGEGERPVLDWRFSALIV